MNTSKPSNVALRRTIEVTAVILGLVAVTAILMPTLRSARRVSYQASQAIKGDYEEFRSGPPAADRAIAGMEIRQVTRGEVRSFVATIDLTSRVSIGTSTPESIYEAKFRADLEARNPDAAGGDVEIRLPLPPQLISLSDLNVTVSGDPSENVFVDGNNLVWRGRLDAGEPQPIKITYTAVGKGLYELQVPPGKIVDLFDVTLTANSSDLRMMELSLQPDEPKREGGKTIYRWRYERLMLGRPIRLDILGIAPMDRLGELVWLGPVSVLIYGLLVALVAMAFHPEALDKWMLLLVLGAFAAAYPLMYYGQDFMSLTTAIVGAAVAMMIVIGARAVTLLGVRVGIGGVVLTGAGVLTLTMLATVYPNTQGLLLTALAIGTLGALMVLVPLAQKRTQAAAAAYQPPAPVTPAEPTE